jgi:two-component system, OmpR family, alkaline phosphatase synthesis response regulator PhoP
MKVLVVDDDTSVRESMQKVLVDAGYEVIVAVDGDEALKRFDVEAIDLLLLDLNLPICSGWDTFERVTTRNPLLPIIIITGQTDQYAMTLAAGAGALLQKPLDAEQLLETMRILLAEPKETRLLRLCGYDQEQQGSVRRRPFLRLRNEEASHPFRYPRSHSIGGPAGH